MKALEKSFAESEKKHASLTQESAQLKDELKRSKDRYDGGVVVLEKNSISVRIGVFSKARI